MCTVRTENDNRNAGVVLKAATALSLSRYLEEDMKEICSLGHRRKSNSKVADAIFAQLPEGKLDVIGLRGLISSPVSVLTENGNRPLFEYIDGMLVSDDKIGLSTRLCCIADALEERLVDVPPAEVIASAFINGEGYSRVMVALSKSLKPLIETEAFADFIIGISCVAQREFSKKALREGGAPIGAVLPLPFCSMQSLLETLHCLMPTLAATLGDKDSRRFMKEIDLLSFVTGLQGIAVAEILEKADCVTAESMADKISEFVPDNYSAAEINLHAERKLEELSKNHHLLLTGAIGA